jgi:hypothetical protein
MMHSTRVNMPQQLVTPLVRVHAIGLSIPCIRTRKQCTWNMMQTKRVKDMDYGHEEGISCAL